MFGIGLPEMIVIFAVALIVVGPDKLPGLARSLAKGMAEMKKTLNQVKESMAQEEETLDSIRHDLRATTDELREKMINADLSNWRPASGPREINGQEEVIDIEPETRAIEAELRAEEPPLPNTPIDADKPAHPLHADQSPDARDAVEVNEKTS